MFSLLNSGLPIPDGSEGAFRQVSERSQTSLQKVSDGSQMDVGFRLMICGDRSLSNSDTEAVRVLHEGRLRKH